MKIIRQAGNILCLFVVALYFAAVPVKTISSDNHETVPPASPLNTKVRVYSGHAGWTPGQLQHEIMRGDWITIKADLNKIFSEEPARIWPSIFKIREDMMI